MKIFIFDMDGVLLAAGGYHRALKETVRLAGLRSGFGEVLLTDEQIARFEALGISSEWHSSALCMAWMVLKQEGNGDEKREESGLIDLDELFEAIADEPIGDSPVKRGLAVIERFAQQQSVPAEPAKVLLAESDNVHSSPTMNWFQELILGSEQYSWIYQRPAIFNTESYLKLYDRPLLNKHKADELIAWASMDDQGAGIMTSRPSHGPQGYSNEPDAHMGVEVVGLQGLPLVGNGEIHWLSERTGKPVEDLLKPAGAHALAAILAAGGWPLEQCLAYVAQVERDLDALQKNDLMHLDGCVITIFEDTISGMVAIEKAVGLLDQAGLRIVVRKIGIAQDAAKRGALSAIGAEVFPDINYALEEIGL